RVGDEAVPERRPLLGQQAEGLLHHPDRLGGLVVGEDEEHVRALRGGGGSPPGRREQEEARQEEEQTSHAAMLAGPGRGPARVEGSDGACRFMETREKPPKDVVRKQRRTAEKLRLDRIERHIFLCCDPTKPKCASRKQTLKAWKYLQLRLRELGLSRKGGV